ncbi:hypothetical protein ACHAXT_005275 [Thalassiosira profunda]
MSTQPATESRGSADAPPPAKPDPVSVAFVVGNTYRRLDPSEASYDKRTGRQLKVHDWTLYVDVLPGQDPDIIDRVTFEMRDDSFVTNAFTCHCPIRIREDVGSAFLGRISGASNANNSQKERGQRTGEEAGSKPPAATRPHPNQSRWRFSTRQQTYGPVDVQISIRGRGGCRCTVPYRIVLAPGGNECPPESLPEFVEKRPYQQLKPLKMMDDALFSLEMQFVLDGGVAPSSSLHVVAKSIYARSKLPIRVLLDDGRTEDFASKPSAASKSWVVQLLGQSIGRNTYVGASRISILSPDLSGGQGVNDCYKCIEGLPPSCTVSQSPGLTNLHVQIDVSNLSLPQMIKVCQNFVKYEEATDSFVPWGLREDRCDNCRSNKQAAEGSSNKQRNELIGRCKSLEELVKCVNPVADRQYKLSVRGLLGDISAGESASKQSIEFRQHVSSKDKTTVTNWIRFCAAFVRNSARLRSPMALKATTSIEEEFSLLFEYVVKDRALRNFYTERKDALVAEEEKERSKSLSEDSMSISDSSEASTPLPKRSKNADGSASNKRACL